MVRPLQEWEAERCSEVHAVHQGALDVVEQDAAANGGVI